MNVIMCEFRYRSSLIWRCFIVDVGDERVVGKLT